MKGIFSIAALSWLTCSIAFSDDFNAADGLSVQKIKKEGKIDVSALTRAEELSIRRNIYAKAIAVSAHTMGPLAGKRAVYVPEDIAIIYKRKPLATLTLLLDIVKGGRPVDARNAACIATALAEDPVAAIPIADTLESVLDEQIENSENTFRHSLVRELTVHLSIKKTK